MCGRSRCIIGLASLFTWLAFFASGIALLAPFWVSFESDGDVLFTKGLVVECENPYDYNNATVNCEASKENTFIKSPWKTVNKNAEGKFGEHFLVVLILWVAGTGIVFLAAIASIVLCCRSCMNKCCSFFNILLVFLGAGALVAAVILFGVNNEHVSFERDAKKGFFDWGFYLAISGAGLAIVSLGFTILTICCIRKEVD